MVTPVLTQAMKINGDRTPTDSPCMGTCSTATFDDICKGCGRTAEEVLRWNFYTDEQKTEINKRLKMTLDQINESHIGKPYTLVNGGKVFSGTLVRSMRFNDLAFSGRLETEYKQSSLPLTRAIINGWKLIGER